MQHVQNRSTTSALVLTAVLIALATLFTMYTKIPVPGIPRLFQCWRCRYYDVSSIIRSKIRRLYWCYRPSVS